jgi:hypothetical protein
MRYQQDILPLYLPGQLVEARLGPRRPWDFRGRIVSVETWETETQTPWNPSGADVFPVRIVHRREPGVDALGGLDHYAFPGSDLRPVPIHVGRGRGRPSLEW